MASLTRRASWRRASRDEEGGVRSLSLSPTRSLAQSSCCLTRLTSPEAHSTEPAQTVRLCCRRSPRADPARPPLPCLAPPGAADPDPDSRGKWCCCRRSGDVAPHLGGLRDVHRPRERRRKPNDRRAPARCLRQPLGVQREVTPDHRAALVGEIGARAGSGVGTNFVADHGALVCRRCERLGELVERCAVTHQEGRGIEFESAHLVPVRRKEFSGGTVSCGQQDVGLALELENPLRVR